MSCSPYRPASAIKSELLTDRAVEEFRRRIIRASCQPDPDAGRRRKLQREVERLSDAIAQGLISQVAIAWLKDTEAALAALPSPNVIDLDAALAALPRAVERYRAIVADLGNAVLGDVGRAREAIREMVGEIRVRPDGKHLIYEMGLNEAPPTALA